MNHSHCCMAWRDEFLEILYSFPLYNVHRLVEIHLYSWHPQLELSYLASNDEEIDIAVNWL